MIQHKVGNMFSNEDRIREGYIVHGCNAQGVMGAGFAAQVKWLYPSAFMAYFESGHLLGTVSFYQTGNLVIANAVTQEFYGPGDKQYVDYDALRRCFRNIAVIAEHTNVPKIVNFPLIGCGLAGGDWEVVSQIIDEELDDTFEKVLWTLK